MEQKRPKRRKDKYNPYTICRMNGKYYICFYNVQKEKICIEISKELYESFDSFELEDKRQLNIYDRYMEHSEVYEWTLEKYSDQIRESAENEALKDITLQELYQAIDLLPDIQRRRLIYYYFNNLTYEEIAHIEKCSFQAVMKSVKLAERKLKEYLE